MAGPNPISADGQFGIFPGHTFIMTENGNACVGLNAQAKA